MNGLPSRCSNPCPVILEDKYDGANVSYADRHRNSGGLTPRTLLLDIAQSVFQRPVQVSECLIDVFDRRLSKTAPLTAGVG
jgi:hypothetical protein